MAPHISFRTRHVRPADPSLPALALQVTHLIDSYMLWVGTTDETAEEVYKAPLQGNLARDWACAMPARDLNMNIPPAATSLFRTSSSDAALSMAQRLARRFKKQIFLSIDLPPAFDSMGQGAKLIFAVEKAVVDMLKEMEQGPHMTQPSRAKGYEAQSAAAPTHRRPWLRG
ncbi:uncharacterized protein LAESUDRAFT_741287 [Laetiporus sulphureus 93-53]|uniref:Uncharacterized protein n=1 Tax=Laetiporus sulphureus 93-53 TaxID=1314785 RepID=A0A165GXB0_9APHY|nr:uncharacterized protein LAESUDRAFT_741287 [Laetiporus sulphureus 93-53]KZT10956.1 hypothetical protein LAESUDRAFT_741287 [Laetiporus sulphureus 93-53]